MKIFIVFNEDIILDLPKSDYVVVSKFRSHSNIYKNSHYLIEDVHINDLNFLQIQEEIFETYITNLPKSLAEIFVASKTSLYFVMIALQNWKNALNDIFSKFSINEVIFPELLEQKFYLPFYEAEGEVTKRLAYETYDFISIALFEHLKLSYPTLKLTVIKRYSVWKLRIRIFKRRYGLLVIKILFHLWRYIKSFKISPPKTTIKEAFFLSRGVAHSQYISDYIKEFDKDSSIYFSEGLRTGGKNESFLSKNDVKEDNCINNDQELSLFNLIKSIFHIQWLLIKYNFVYKRNLKQLDLKYGLSYSSAITEMIIHYLETHIYVTNLDVFFKKKKNNHFHPKVLITCEIYTQYSFFIAKLGAQNNIKTIQLISVAMNTGYLPQYFFCNKVLFNQRQLLESFKHHNPNLAPKCEYWGNLTFNERLLSERNKILKDPLHIVVFTQPVIDEENDFLILNTLIELKKTLSIKVTIKPHPREKYDKFSNYSDEVSISSSTMSIADVIKEADVAIVKFSAVEHYLLNYGIPTIYCLFSQTARDGVAGVLKTGYKGIAQTASELSSLLINFNNLPLLYEDFREKEMAKRFEHKGIYSFNKNLLNFIYE